MAELSYFEKINRTEFKRPVKLIFISLDFKSKLQQEVIPFVQQNKITSAVFLLNKPNQQLYIQRIDKKWSGAIASTLFVNKNTKRFN